MSLWFLLWFLLSFVLLGATFWSTIILIQQKRAWKEYAKKKNISFTDGKFFEPASVEGVVEGYNLSLFTATQQHADTRKDRQLTVLQLSANTSFVDGIACGTSEMKPFLNSLDGINAHDMKEMKWNKNYSIHTRNKKSVDAFLTEERVSILNGILSMPKADILVLLDNNEGVFRFETTNPLTKMVQIENLIKKLIVRVEKLKPSEEELKVFKNLADTPAEIVEEVKAQETKAETEE